MAKNPLLKIYFPLKFLIIKLTCYISQKVHAGNGVNLAHWLTWDEPVATLSGVPSKKDIGRHRVDVKAYGKRGDIAQDSFIVHVIPDRHEHAKTKDGKVCISRILYKKKNT